MAYTLNDALNNINIDLSELGPDRSGDHYEVVSTFAYLIGIGRNIFEKEDGTLSPDIYNKLDKDKNAKIIRNLCLVRTLMVLRFHAICQAIQQDYKSITSVPDIIPRDAISYLEDAGINVYTHNKEPNPFLAELHTQIKNRINNCQKLFPDWINWDYLRDLFVFPGKYTDDTLKQIANTYYENRQFYPYQALIHWTAADDYGNILASDQKFLRLVYEWHGDGLPDLSLVTDVKTDTKKKIYDFFDYAEKLIFVVDCENSDPYSLCATLNSLDKEKTEKISKLVLYDDEHAAHAWDVLTDYTTIPIEYVLIERLKDNKSLADVKVTARITKEFYENGVDSFVLVSSDSDYWGMIEEMPKTNFLVMAEKVKFSSAMRDALRSRGIFYCYIEDFYSGDNSKIKTSALIRETNRVLTEHFAPMTVDELMETVFRNTRMDITPTLRKTYEDKYIKNLHIEISDDGEIQIKTEVR